METLRKGRSNDAPSFWIVVADHEAKSFAVFGPLVEDAQWTRRVARARAQGRDVTLRTVRSEGDAKSLTRHLAVRGYVGSEYAIL
jgi:hypothetical protein